jgi:8-oxo-dGTP diphosphatase
MKMVDVAAALIWDEQGRFLICQRPAHKARGLMWEFVGGKAEPGEALEDTLIRECREELDVTVKPTSVYVQLVHEYPDITIRLTLFNAVITDGQPRMLEHNDIRWIFPSQIPNFTFCPADKDILKMLLAQN